MATVYVQFSDSTLATVIAAFGCPQDPTAYPNQATIDSSDARYQAFISPPLTPAQMALAQEQAGVAVTNTADGWTATFALTPAASSSLSETYNLIQSFGGAYPAGMTVMHWSDVSGTPHAFASASTFIAFAKAVGVDILQLGEIAAANTGTFTVTTITIP